MPTDYQRYIEAMTSLLVTEDSDENFTTIIPAMIAYAEGRVYRELDLLATVVTDTSKSCVAGNRLLSLPTKPRFKIVSNLNVVVPANASTPNAGARNPLIPVAKEYIDFVWNAATSAAQPVCFAMLTDQTILLGPWPDQAYPVEIVGIVTPDVLSNDNPSTFLTQSLWDLFIAASMVFGTGYQRDFGAQSSDPQAAQSWETQYGKLLASANADEMRRKFSGAAGTSAAQSVVGGQG